MHRADASLQLVGMKGKLDLDYQIDFYSANP